eukprot:819561-Rhodomonas_salina.1
MKQWVSISTEALPKLLQAVYYYWYPLTGDFNFNCRVSTFICSHGGYVDGDSYKWQLHQRVTHHYE